MARTNHTRINELVNETTKTIDDELLFSSNAMSGYFTDIANMILISWEVKETVRVKLYWDSEKWLARVTGSFIEINAGNHICNGYERVSRMSFVKGLLLHEIGHIMFTDFSEWSNFIDITIQGNLLHAPATEDLNQTEMELIDNFRSFIFQIQNEQVLSVLIGVYFKDMFNIIEDGYLEEYVCDEVPGYKDSLEEKRDAVYHQFPTVMQILDQFQLSDQDKQNSDKAEFNKALAAYGRLRDLILQYALYAEVKGDDYLHLVPEVRLLYDIMPIVDHTLSLHSSKERLKWTVLIVATTLPLLAPIIEYLVKNIPDIEENKKLMQQAVGKATPGSSMPAGRTSNGSAMQGKASNSEQNTNDGKSSFDQQNENFQEEAKLKKEAAASGSDTNVKRKKDSDASSKKEAKDAERKVRKREPQSSKHAKSPKHQLSNPGTTAESRTSDELERLLNQLALQIAEQKREDEQLDDLKCFVQGIKYPEIHKGIKAHLHRNTMYPSDELINLYDKTFDHCRLIIKKLVGTLSKELKNRRRGSKETGKYMGNRFETHTIMRNDGKHFSKRSLPTDKPRVVMGHLIDTSDSMSGRKVHYAVLAEFVLFHFCAELGIPHACYGHHAHNKSTDIGIYANFKSVDNYDKYRILDLECGGNNRDGFALRFACEQLYKQDADIKLLVITSDGKPNSTSYSGQKAYEDIASVVKEFTKKGLFIIAAAIDEDKETIKNIYGEQRFLDIEDLESFPEQITNIVKRFIK